MVSVFKSDDQTFFEYRDARAVISADELRCERLTVGDWDVLGPGGVSVNFSPTAATLTTAWFLNDEGLVAGLRVDNPTRSATSFALSVRAELNPVGEHVQAIVGAEAVWPVTLDAPPEPVSGVLDLRRPRRIDAPLDAHYTRRHFANLRASVAILDPSTGREVWLNSSADFAELWISIDTRGAGILETSLCPPVPRGAARRLAPGESWRGSAQLSVRRAHQPGSASSHIALH